MFNFQDNLASKYKVEFWFSAIFLVLSKDAIVELFVMMVHAEYHIFMYETLVAPHLLKLQICGKICENKAKTHVGVRHL